MTNSQYLTSPFTDQLGKDSSFHVKKSGFDAPAEFPAETQFEVEENPHMSQLSRNELDDVLTATQKKIDRHFKRRDKADKRRLNSENRAAESQRREQEARDRLFDEKLESMTRRMDDRERIIDTKLDSVSINIKAMTEKVNGFADTLTKSTAEVKASNRNTVLGILAIGVTTVLGLWGANSTIVGSASSIFQAGQQQRANEEDLKSLILEAKAQSEQTRKLLESIKVSQPKPTTE